MAKSVRGVYSGGDGALVVLVAEDGNIRLTVVRLDRTVQSVDLPAPAARRLGERLIQAAEAAAPGDVSRD